MCASSLAAEMLDASWEAPETGCEQLFSVQLKGVCVWGGGGGCGCTRARVCLCVQPNWILAHMCPVEREFGMHMCPK